MQTAAGRAARTAPQGASDTIDPAEIERFNRSAAEWWDGNGKFRTLHLIGPARMTFLRDALVRHFGRPPGQMRPDQADEADALAVALCHAQSRQVKKLTSMIEGALRA